jgi:hypothetical protein
MGGGQIRFSDSFGDCMRKRGTSQLQNNGNHFLEDKSGRLLNKYWFEFQMVIRFTAIGHVFRSKRVFFLASVVHCSIRTVLNRGTNSTVRLGLQTGIN